MTTTGDYPAPWRASTDDLLAARIFGEIEETERMANAAVEEFSSPRWLAVGDVLYEGAGNCWSVLEGLRRERVGPHMARNDPESTLSRCAADRRVLDRHRYCGRGSGYCDDGGHGFTEPPYGCPDLHDLAERYGLPPEGQASTAG